MVDRMSAIACADCRFFCVTVSRVSALKYVDGIGECRRNAPRGPVVFAWGAAGEPEDQHRAVMSPFPFMPADDWCGEFERRPATAEAVD